MSRSAGSSPAWRGRSSPKWSQASWLAVQMCAAGTIASGSSMLPTVTSTERGRAVSRKVSAVRQGAAACGTALTFRETARPRSVDVTVGSMDEPDAIVPAAHIWTASQLAWLHLGDDLPRHAGEDPAERDIEA